MENCNTCKWGIYLARMNAKRVDELPELGIKRNDILNTHCKACVEEFREKWDGVCFDCLWKDRNLPFERRKLHCDACAESYAKRHTFACAQSVCQWDNPKRRMPSDASLAHCKACMATRGERSGAMNCENCRFASLPEIRRKPICIGCSAKFAENKMVVGSTNELSNKGETIISYDNHNENMTDDRDTVVLIKKEYSAALKPSEEHPLDAIAKAEDKSPDGIARAIYGKMKRFLRELADLPDMQALVILSRIRGEKQTDFAKNHDINDSVAHNLLVRAMAKTNGFADFMRASYSYNDIASLLKNSEEMARRSKGGSKPKGGGKPQSKRTKTFIKVEQLEFDFSGGSES